MLHALPSIDYTYTRFWEPFVNRRRAVPLSPSEQLHELVNRQSSVGDDATQRAGSKLLVVGDNDPGVRSIAPEDHVAAGLAPVGSLVTWHLFAAGKVSPYAASISTNSLPASVGTGSPASRQSST